jgi:hypothetical protein
MHAVIMGYKHAAIVKKEILAYGIIMTASGLAYINLIILAQMIVLIMIVI